MAKHQKTNGSVPILHWNTGKLRTTVYAFEVVRETVQFSKNYAEVCTQIATTICKTWKSWYPLVVYLASQNFKTVHDLYVKMAIEQDPSQHIMQYRSFLDVWNKCIPEVQFMTPRTDVCYKWEYYRNHIK